ncbi:MAG: NAD-dependent epimerase/dehydratase family protein [Alphaproteobacteria bacterium]|nr:NAD-dependent epimerase/dehydratase family protein [Alphaproteobacteria bacterium]
MSIIVTGSNGFFGKPLAEFLTRSGYDVYGVQRQKTTSTFQQLIMPDFHDQQKWNAILKDKKTIIHCAARVHQMNDKNNFETQKLYFDTNYAITKKIVDAALVQNVKHFIFISSVAAYPFDLSLPQTELLSSLRLRWSFYGESKYKAEEYLRSIKDMKITILRPPLIYGPHVKGNLETLVKLVQKKIPLPFKSIATRKSLISIDNFLDLILNLISNPNAWDKTYFVKDYDLPLNAIIAEMCKTLNMPSQLFAFPEFFLNLMIKTPILGHKVERFMQELVFDDTPIRDALKWAPSFSYQDGIKKMVQSF